MTPQTPPCPPWCQSDHGVWRHVRPLVLHSAPTYSDDSGRRVLIQQAGGQQAGGEGRWSPRTIEPRVVMLCGYRIDDPFLELAPEQAADLAKLLAADAPELAAGLAQAAQLATTSDGDGADDGPPPEAGAA